MTFRATVVSALLCSATIALSAQAINAPPAKPSDVFAFMPGMDFDEIVRRLGAPRQCFSAPVQRSFPASNCDDVRRQTFGLVWDVFERPDASLQQSVRVMFKAQRPSVGEVPRIVLDSAHVDFGKSIRGTEALDSLPEARQLCGDGCAVFSGALDNVEVCRPAPDYTRIGGYRVPYTVVSLQGPSLRGMKTLDDEAGSAEIWTTDQFACRGTFLGTWHPRQAEASARDARPFRYVPPLERSRDAFEDLVIDRTDLGDAYRYEIGFSLSKTFDAKYRNLQVYGMRVIDNRSAGSVPSGILHDVTGEFEAGQRITVSATLPKVYTNPADGWALRICAGLTKNAGCMPSRNLLVADR